MRDTKLDVGREANEAGRAPAQLFVSAAALVTAAGIAIAVFATNPTSVSPPCWRGDAQNYCAVSIGHRATEPFNRRIVVPELVRVFPGSLSARYRAVAIISLAIIACVAVVLALRLCRRLGLSSGATQAVAVAIVAAIVVVPDGLRLAWSMPILVDEGGLAAGLVWLALFTSRDPRVQAASMPAAALAVATREVWAGVIVACACLGLFWGARGVAALNIVVCVAVFVAVKSVPSAPRFDVFGTLPGENDFQVARFWFDARKSSLSNFVNTIWSLVFAVGLFPLLLARTRVARWLLGELKNGELTAPVLAVAGALMVATAPFLGADVTRLAYPGGVLLMIVAVPWAATCGWSTIPLLVGTLAIWEPTHALIAKISDYNAFYVAGQRVGLDLRIAVVAGTLAVAVGVVNSVLARRRLPAG